MKKTSIIILLLLATFDISAQEKDFPKLTGPYLGQIPPVKEPVLFAPGIVSNGRNHSSVAISPDGSELYWSAEDRRIWFTRVEKGY